VKKMAEVLLRPKAKIGIMLEAEVDPATLGRNE